MKNVPTNYRFGVDPDPAVALPFGEQLSMASMSKMRKGRSFYFLSIIKDDATYTDLTVVNGTATRNMSYGRGRLCQY
jgi:hypothetical protein